jgi:hypothetical protein
MDGIAYLSEASVKKKKRVYKLRPGAACRSRQSLCLRIEPRKDQKYFFLSIFKFDAHFSILISKKGLYLRNFLIYSYHNY